MGHEDLHKALYRAHHDLGAAADRLHVVIVEILKAGRYPDERKQFADVIDQLCRARDMTDEARSAASIARTEIIRLTGCSGECN